MRTYGQYCALAKPLDHVGDRWTLLVIRELLVEPRRYSQIRAALPGIATNLLAERLRGLEGDGLVRRAGPDGAYELTDAGRGLEGAVNELIRWGDHWMGPKEPEEWFRPEWLVVALKALLPRRRKGRVEIHVDGSVVGVDRGGVTLGRLTEPDAVVEGPPDAVLGAVVGKLPFSVLSVTGDARVAEEVLVARRAPGGSV